MSAAHSPAPWEVVEVNNEGDYGDGGPDPSSGFDSFAIVDANGRVVCDTLNNETAVVVEDPHADDDGGVHAWDEVAKADMEHVARCVNERDELIAALRVARGYVAEYGSPDLAQIDAALAAAAAP